MVVRRLAYALGFRFRLHRRDLPGNPDLVFSKLRLCIFVHGCFWHQHQGCKKARRPTTNTDFWDRKLTANVERDLRVISKLTALGWHTLTIWECQTKDSIWLGETLRNCFATLIESGDSIPPDRITRDATHESPDVDLTIPAVTAPHYLWAILSSDGTSFRQDNYETTREYLRRAVDSFSSRKTGGQAPNPNVTESRLRTWKAAFEELGLLTVDGDGLVRATRFGRAVLDSLESARDAGRSEPSDCRVGCAGSEPGPLGGARRQRTSSGGGAGRRRPTAAPRNVEGVPET
jgi:DNA mismatch endonuclease, patch repair protein